MKTLTPASEKQIGYIKSLIASRDWTAKPFAASVQLFLGGERIDIKTASYLINNLRDCKITTAPAKSAAKLEEGVYSKDSVIYRVVTSATGNRYAKALSGTKWIYAAGAAGKLTEADKLSLEDAKAYGKKTGICCVCGALLTNADSIEAGIGPICASKF